jgi:hypothetical protein
MPHLNFAQINIEILTSDATEEKIDMITDNCFPSCERLTLKRQKLQKEEHLLSEQNQDMPSPSVRSRFPLYQLFFLLIGLVQC